MNSTRIILVEGMPGTGKSTVAQYVHRQLSASGRPSHWCHEECTPHPVRLFYERERHSSWTGYSEEALSLWERYAQALQTGNQITVFDAAILQNHARAMLLYGCDWQPILNLVRRIESLLKPLHPLWIYLKPANVERNFRDIVEVRGQRLLDLWLRNQEQFPYAQKTRTTGFPGFIAFWEEFGQLSDQVFDELTIANLRQTVSQQNWGLRRSAELLSFLGLPLPSDSSSAVKLERFAGEYKPLDGRSTSEFALQIRDGCLIMSCSEPSIDVQRGPIGCYGEVRLIPIENNRFYVETWPHEVEFTEDPLGSIASMRLSVREDGWGQSKEVFVRSNCAPVSGDATGDSRRA